MMARSLESQADQGNTQTTLYDVGKGEARGKEMCRLGGISALEVQLGEERFSHTWRGSLTLRGSVGMGRDLWGYGGMHLMFLPPLLPFNLQEPAEDWSLLLCALKLDTFWGPLQVTLSIRHTPA